VLQKVVLLVPQDAAPVAEEFPVAQAQNLAAQPQAYFPVALPEFVDVKVSPEQALSALPRQA
jgi:hypothetical protein